MRKTGLLLIVIMLALSGCATPRSGESSVSQLQTIGEKYLAAGDIPNALKYLSQAEAKHPDDPVILFDLGLAYHKRGMTTEAIARFKKALQVKPNYPEALNALGVVYAETGQTELARASFEKVLSDPFYHTPQLAAFNLARIHEKNGENERALRLYEQAVQFQSNYGTAWYRMGIVLEAMGRATEARNAYGKAISASPEMADAHLHYGMLSFQSGNYEAAFFSLNKVTRLVPNTSTADEARIQLEKVRTVMQKKGTLPGSRFSSANEIEVFPLPQEKPAPKASAHPQYPSMPSGAFPPGSLIITPSQESPSTSSPAVASAATSPPSQTPAVPKSDASLNTRTLGSESVPPSTSTQKQEAKSAGQDNAPLTTNAPEPGPVPTAIPKEAQEPASATESRTPSGAPPLSPDPFNPPPALKETPAAASEPEIAPPASSAPPQTESAAPVAHADSAPVQKQPPQYNYIVQVGSFDDKAQADEVRSQLQARGYRATIRSQKSSAHGKVYVVQLKAEPTYSKANTLMIQLGNEVPGKPVIVKVPVEMKSVEPVTQQQN